MSKPSLRPPDTYVLETFFAIGRLLKRSKDHAKSVQARHSNRIANAITYAMPGTDNAKSENNANAILLSALSTYFERHSAMQDSMHNMCQNPCSSHVSTQMCKAGASTTGPSNSSLFQNLSPERIGIVSLICRTAWKIQHAVHVKDCTLFMSKTDSLLNLVDLKSARIAEIYLKNKSMSQL